MRVEFALGCSHFKMNLVDKIALLALRAYKAVISPWLPVSCRYVPTCSEYAMEAVERHGALRGSWMALCRILRCHPFVPGGYDPVADKTPTSEAHDSGVACRSN